MKIDTSGKWNFYTYSPLPRNLEAIGVVTCDNGEMGALVRFLGTGIYAMSNAGTIRSLDQKQVIAALSR